MHESIHDHHRQPSTHWWFRGRHRIFEAMLDRYVELPKNSRVLDIGPGSGINLPILGAYGSVTVLDRDSGSLRSCRSNSVKLSLGDAHQLPFAEGAFQLTCALDVLEHLDDDVTALREMYRVTARGGYLLLSVPACMLLWGRQDLLSHHKRRYARKPLESLLQGAGFSILRLSYFNSLLFPPILLWRLLSRPFMDRSKESGRSDFDVQAPFRLDQLLYRTFAGEAQWLRTRDFPIGVSLLALCKKP